MKKGNLVKLTNEFLEEGRKLFGDEFSQPKNRNHKFEIVEIEEWQGDNGLNRLAIVKLNGFNPKHWVKIGKGQAQICADFLELA